MGRIIGKVESGDGSEAMYFVHCDTSMSSYTPLFPSVLAAWSVYDTGGFDALFEAVPAKGKKVRVIRKTLSPNRGFDDGTTPYGDVRYGLATEDRLLTPTDAISGVEYVLLRRGEMLHVAAEVRDILGSYDSPVCVDRWEYARSDERILFEDYYGRELELCPHCIQELLR